MKGIELLSPAGDFESLKLAIINGADAVYFGAKNFNARAKADNFGENLKDAITFCHLYGKKAYLTLNTLVENEDIDDLIACIKDAQNSGIDAFIVQDFGVLNIIKNAFSGIEIHASTQMAVNNYLGAKRAEELGIKRVVLSRETNLEDIKKIKETTNLEIEFFIQGALCVCVSGNCYLSSRLFGKSGNKGECLQPCRLPYTAMLGGSEIKKGYLLSAKDISMRENLSDLAEAGVCSFKIEGRLRRPAYVAGVTSIYRKIIDHGFRSEKQDGENLKKLFNRGDYTPGYFNGNGDIIDDKVQGHKGVYIGKIAGFSKGSKFNLIKINSQKEINSGDVLKFFKNGLEVGTLSAYDVKFIDGQYVISTTQNISTGCDVHLILDSVQEDRLLNKEKKLPVDFKLTAVSGQRLTLEYTFNNMNGCSYGNVCEDAKSQPLGEDEARSQLSKLASTNFYLRNFEFVSDGVFVRKSELNFIRNDAVQQIIDGVKSKGCSSVQYEYTRKVLSQNFENIPVLTFEIAEKTDCDKDILIVRPSNYNTFDFSAITHKNAYLYVPSFLRSEDIALIEKILNNNENLGIYAENIAFSKYNNKKIILGAKLNIKNAFAIKELMHENVVAVVASPELTETGVDSLKKYSSVPILSIDFDTFDLMSFVHCPIKTIFKNNCNNCKYEPGITYKMDNGIKLKLKRYKLANCYFTLCLK